MHLANEVETYASALAAVVVAPKLHTNADKKIWKIVEETNYSCGSGECQSYRSLIPYLFDDLLLVALSGLCISCSVRRQPSKLSNTCYLNLSNLLIDLTFHAVSMQKGAQRRAKRNDELDISRLNPLLALFPMHFQRLWNELFDKIQNIAHVVVNCHTHAFDRKQFSRGILDQRGAPKFLP
jgi:hypothetical protein